MKLAFSRPTANLDEQRALFAQFRTIGYEGLQLKAGQYRDYLDTPQRFQDDWGAYPGVASGLITMGTLTDEGQAALRKLIRFASAVGSEKIVFVHNHPREGVTDDEIRGFARLLSELGQEARNQGVSLSLHHHFDQPVMHRRDIETFFTQASNGSVGLTVDTAHLVKSGIDDVAGVIRDFSSVIDNLHLKDFADGNWQVLGHGKIDFPPIFSAIHGTAYDGWACADEESGGALVEGMQDCYAFMHAGLCE